MICLYFNLRYCASPLPLRISGMVRRRFIWTPKHIHPTGNHCCISYNAATICSYLLSTIYLKSSYVQMECKRISKNVKKFGSVTLKIIFPLSTPIPLSFLPKHVKTMKLDCGYRSKAAPFI